MARPSINPDGPLSRQEIQRRYRERRRLKAEAGESLGDILRHLRRAISRIEAIHAELNSATTNPRGTT